MKLKSTRNGFTLIELLVVISIIALLVSILLPALSGARDQAKIAVCSVQMKQLGVAVYQYAGDNKDAYPSAGPRATAWFGTQSDGQYFAYYETPTHGTEAGPSNLGRLILAGLVPNDGSITCCPGYRNPTFTEYFSSHQFVYRIDLNSHGDPTHWNYAGVNAGGGMIFDPDAYPNHMQDHSNYRLLPQDEAKVGWMNLRTGYSWRNLENLGIKNIARAKMKSFISDVWFAKNSAYWRMHIKQLSHVKGNGASAKINVWYFDGHVEGRELDRSIYFVDGGQDDGFFKMNPPVTWEVLFEDKKYGVN
jgi:prepilin-type N-terminal cleavage/methylation domain-containing protein/prepilin-type processing-associated H-X9-DG protein